MKIYVDGVAGALTQGAGAVPATLTSAGSATVKIGKFGGSLRRWFNGSIDDVRIYNRPLSHTEIQAIYAQTMTGHYGELSRLLSRRLRHVAVDSGPVVVAPVVSRHVVSMQHTRSTQPAAFAQHTAHTTFTRQGSEP